MSDPHTPHIDPEGLGAAIAAWQADGPATVAYPELTASADAATAAVLAAMAHWPGEHTMMATRRADKATRFAGAAAAAIGIEVGTDDDNAVRISAIDGV